LNSPIDLVKAVRSGQLSVVVAALDAGAPVELDDGLGVPGLPLGVACFMGHAEIVRELVKRGAQVNLPDNREPVSPLSMALRGGRTEIVRLLVELGVEIPPGMQTGLSEAEIRATQRAGTVFAGWAEGDLPDIEEIEIVRCFGTDTGVLEADVIRAAREMEALQKAAKKA